MTDPEDSEFTREDRARIIQYYLEAKYSFEGRSVALKTNDTKIWYFPSTKKTSVPRYQILVVQGTKKGRFGTLRYQYLVSMYQFVVSYVAMLFGSREVPNFGIVCFE